MRRIQDTPTDTEARCAEACCNHPLALVIDPTEPEISELEKMLANCPNCSMWSPGDGPIMAVISSHDAFGHAGPKKLL